MRATFLLLLSSLGLAGLGLAGCDGCGSSPEAGVDAAPPSGTVVGRVVSPHAGGVDVVPRAVVIHPSGVRAVAGDDGTFVLAGVPIGPATLRVEGPRAADPDAPLSYAPGFAAVEVALDAEVAVEPALLLGCERTFDPTVATVLPLRGCGADRGSIELPAGAIADGAEPFTGRVRAELAVLDPADPEAQRLALEPPDTAEPVELNAGVSVRLTDAATGAPLHLAAGQVARLRLPIAAAAGGTSLALAWRDDAGATTAQPDLIATTTQDATGAYAVLEVSHFSSYMMYSGAGWRPDANLAIHGWIGSANSCGPGGSGCIVSSLTGQDVNPTCAGTVCVNQSISVEVRWGTHRVHGVTGRALGLPADTYVTVRLHHVNALARSFAGTPIYDSGWFGLRTPPAGQRADVGPVAVPAVPEGCATLQLPAGACSSGPLRIFRGDEVIQASYGDFCAGACVVVPSGGDLGLSAETPSGRRVVLDGNPAFHQTCGGGSCTALGASAPTPPHIGVYIAVSHRHNLALTARAAAGGDPGTAFTVDLDGAGSTGLIDTFAWTVFAVEAGGEVPIWDAAGADNHSTVALDAGTYRVRARGYGGRGQWDETSTMVTLGGVPTTEPVASFTVNPAAPTAGSSFELNASGSTSSSPIISYAWDLDGNGTFESTQVTPYTHYYFPTPGPHPITLRITDQQQRTAQTTRTVVVGGGTNQVTITVTRAGNLAGAYVISVPAGISCSEGTSAVCTTTFARGANIHLDAYVNGTPAHSAWAGMPGADGYQLFLGSVQADRSVTATFP